MPYDFIHRLHWRKQRLMCMYQRNKPAVLLVSAREGKRDPHGTARMSHCVVSRCRAQSVALLIKASLSRVSGSFSLSADFSPRSAACIATEVSGNLFLFLDCDRQNHLKLNFSSFVCAPPLLQPSFFSFIVDCEGWERENTRWCTPLVGFNRSPMWVQEILACPNARGSGALLSVNLDTLVEEKEKAAGRKLSKDSHYSVRKE